MFGELGWKGRDTRTRLEPSVWRLMFAPGRKKRLFETVDGQGMAWRCVALRLLKIESTRWPLLLLSSLVERALGHLVTRTLIALGLMVIGCANKDSRLMVPAQYGLMGLVRRIAHLGDHYVGPDGMLLIFPLLCSTLSQVAACLSA